MQFQSHPRSKETIQSNPNGTWTRRSPWNHRALPRQHIPGRSLPYDPHRAILTQQKASTDSTWLDLTRFDLNEPNQLKIMLICWFCRTPTGPSSTSTSTVNPSLSLSLLISINRRRLTHCSYDPSRDLISPSIQHGQWSKWPWASIPPSFHPHFTPSISWYWRGNSNAG